eukprot:272366_1
MEEYIELEVLVAQTIWRNTQSHCHQTETNDSLKSRTHQGLHYPQNKHKSNTSHNSFVQTQKPKSVLASLSLLPCIVLSYTCEWKHSGILLWFPHMTCTYNLCIRSQFHALQQMTTSINGIQPHDSTETTSEYNYGLPQSECDSKRVVIPRTTLH